MDTQGQYSVEQLGQMTKAKYPAYAHMSDAEVGQKVIQAYPQYQTHITQPANPLSGVLGVLGGLAKPFIQTGQTIGGAAFEGARALDQAAGSPVAKAMGNQSDYVDRNGGSINNPLLSNDQLQQYNQNPLGAIGDQAKASAGVASYAVPFGKGANLISKALLPGAGAGALSAISNGDNPISGGVTGAVTGGVLGKGGDALGAMLQGTGKQLDAAGNQFVKAQYNVGRGVADRNQLGNTIDQLKNMGIYNINDVTKLAPLITGKNGLLNQFVKESVAHSTPVDTTGLSTEILPQLMADHGEFIKPGIKEEIAKNLTSTVSKMAPKGTDLIAGGDPVQAFQAIQDWEEKGYDYLHKNDVGAQQAGKVYLGMANELKNRLFEGTGANGKPTGLGANDVLVNSVLTPENKAKLEALSPHLAKAIASARTIRDVRALEAPFVRGSNLASESENANINKPFNLRDFIAGMAGNSILPGVGLAAPIALRLAGSDTGLSAAGKASTLAGNSLQKAGGALTKAGNPINAVGSVQNADLLKLLGIRK